jgi:hypothetical protein
MLLACVATIVFLTLTSEASAVAFVVTGEGCCGSDDGVAVK